jgi:hypothetical protein
MEKAHQPLSDFNRGSLKQPIESITEVRVNAMLERDQTYDEIIEVWSKFFGHGFWESVCWVLVQFDTTTREAVQKTQTPPVSAAWSFNFNLTQKP